MKRLSKSEVLGRICIPIVETTVNKALRTIKEADPFADIIELRVDYLKKVELEPLMNDHRKPLIITNRRKGEGGRYVKDERNRVAILREAITLGAEYVDVEVETEGSLLKDLVANKKGAQIVLSFHNFQSTPPPEELKGLWGRMNRLGADIVKIVTFARSWEDNLLILSLIPFAKKRKHKILAFCMGKKGRMSRVFAPLLGAEWTYASLRKSRASAPGQLNIWQMGEIWEKLR